MDDDNWSGEHMEEILNEEDILEVIDLDDDDNGAHDEEGNDLVDDMEDMVLDGENFAMVQEGVKVDDADIVFTEHQGSVFCVGVGPDGLSVVTGGEDDLAYVWDMSTGDVKLKCQDHKDSVVACGFNRNGRYVATADMSGLVQVWTTENGKLALSVESSDIEWLTWHHMTEAVLVGTADGAVWMWRVPSGECKIYQGPDCACSCGKVTPDGKLVVAGYGDGSVRVWDLKTATVIYSTTGQDLHGGTVTSLDLHSDNNLVVTSSVDASAKLISIHSKKVIRTIDTSKPRPTAAPPTADDDTDDDVTSSDDQPEVEDGLECARFCGNFPYLAMGSLDGRLIVWDLSSDSVRCTCQHAAGIVTCIWDPHQPVVYTCTLDGLVHEWDARTGIKTRQWSGHGAEILSLVMTKDGERLLSSSDDGTARVFTITGGER